jgi:surfactin synthase thioesterase subunit
MIMAPYSTLTHTGSATIEAPRWAPPQLICFHHAGGGSSAFRGWRTALADQGRLHAVQLPGREDRYQDPRHVDLARLVDDVAAELADVLTGPHVFFGHSMGALIAYYVARQRIAAGHRPPEQLIVAASAAPHLNRPLFAVDEMTDRQLGEALHQIGGLPDELLHRPDWLGPILSVVRDDIRVCNSHSYRPLPPLPCPIHAFGGRHDPLVSEADVRGWSRHTSAEFDLTMLDAGHFLVQDASAGLRDHVFTNAGMR